MSEKTTAEEILEFAINAEQESADLYEGLAKQARNSAIKKSFLEFAKEELGHKAKILEVKAGNRQLKADGEVMDLGGGRDRQRERQGDKGELLHSCIPPMGDCGYDGG